jgi:PAS domain S-box-containing protein
MQLKVLVIEDNEDDAALLARYLNNCGFEPKWQRVDTESALAEAVEDRRWDLVLCDLSMPRLTPFLAADCVRRVNPDIPIIIVTGAINEDTAALLIQHGIQGIVLKDDLPRLKSVIESELALAQNRRDKAAAELRLANALDKLYQGVALYDPNARLITCNQRYKLTLDRCQNDIVPGMFYSDLLRMAVERGQFTIGVERAEAALKRLLSYQVHTSEPFELRQHDGRWIEVQRHRTEDGGIVTVTTDITEAKRREETLIRHATEVAKINNDLLEEIRRREAMEDALRESETRARAIFESAVDGVITFDQDRRIETVNPAAAKLFGYDAEELAGSHVHHLMMLGAKHDVFEPMPLHLPADSIDLTDSGPRLVTGWRRNGEVFPIELTVSEVRLKDRCIYTGIIRDVTERTKLDKMKREFVSVVSHELRTPLTSIQGSLALLNSHVVGELSPRAGKMVQIGLENCERLLSLLGDILDMEKIEAGKMEFAFEPVPVRALLERAVEANRAFVEKYQARVAVEHAQGPDLMVNGDGDRLMQVLANFVSNAAKYSPADGVVTIGAALRGGQIRIYVRDQGPGIPPNFHDRMFQKFSQADASDTRQKGGTGLGLSIAKAIVECHGGAIGFHTGDGEDTTFYFDLPILHATASGTQVSPPPSRPARMLFCGAPSGHSAALQGVAARMNWTVELCWTPDEAERRLRENTIDAIAFGPPTPAFNPAGLMKLCGGDSGAGNAPIAMLMGDISGAEGKYGRVIRLLDWVEKPVDIDRLRRRIENAELADLSRAPRILCLGVNSDESPCGTAATQAGVDLPPKSAANGASTDRVHLAIIDATGLSAAEALSLRALCETAAPPPMIIVSEPGMPQSAWDRLNASLGASFPDPGQFVEDLQKLINAKGVKQSLEQIEHQESVSHERATADHLC